MSHWDHGRPQACAGSGVYTCHNIDVWFSPWAWASPWSREPRSCRLSQGHSSSNNAANPRREPRQNRTVRASVRQWQQVHASMRGGLGWGGLRVEGWGGGGCSARDCQPKCAAKRHTTNGATSVGRSNTGRHHHTPGIKGFCRGRRRFTVTVDTEQEEATFTALDTSPHFSTSRVVR
jgi:hypothetical protein